MSGDLTDLAIARILKRLGLGPECLHELAAVLGFGALDDARADPHLAALVTEAHSGSWFGIEGLPDPVAITKGTLPGDPLGDGIYNFLMTKILTAAHGAMRTDGL